jgi:hypothetical protein
VEASPAPGPTLAGRASVTATGDISLTVELPPDPDTTIPSGDGSFDLRYVDSELDTLLVTLTVAGGTVTDAFVGVGLPGTSIFEPDYFADFLHTQCQVEVTRLDASGVDGSFWCVGLENGEGTKTIDASGTFDLFAAAGAPEPSGSPVPAGSPAPGPSASAMP